MNIDNGGPAFPSHGSMGEVTHEGMSLRDHFAGEALNAVIGGRSWSHIDQDHIMEVWAQAAYAVADAMLAERAKGGVA